MCVLLIYATQKEGVSMAYKLVTIKVDFAAIRAKSPIRQGETKAQFRARVARELAEEGDLWTAYQVLHNTEYTDHFYCPKGLVGGFADGDIDKTATIVQEEYELLVEEQRVAEAARLDHEREKEEFRLFVKKWRRILTLGLWD